MIKLFNPADVTRNLTGLVVALVLGTTLIAAAAGPAATGVTAAAESNIVARA